MSVHHALSLPILVPQGKTPHSLPLLQHEGPSHGRQFSTNFSSVSPSHGLQLFTNCPSVAPSHGVQSFRNRLLQRGSPMGSQTLPANLPQHGLLSPWVRRSWQDPAPVWAHHGVTASFRHPPAPAWGPFHELQVDLCSTVDLHGLQRDNLPYHGLQHELQGKTLLWHLEHLLPPPSSLTLVSAELFHIVSLLSFICPPTTIFFPA